VNYRYFLVNNVNNRIIWGMLTIKLNPTRNDKVIVVK